MTLSVDIWSDIACPWCYIGKRRFARALDAFAHRDQVTVSWHSYLLDPSLPERYDGSERDYLIARKGMAPEQIDQMMGMVAENAAAEGLAFDWDAVVPASSVKGHLLLQAARALGADADGLKETLLRAHFVEGKVISDEEVLVESAVAHGLDAEQARAAFTDPAARSGFESDLVRANQIGVQGVPFFVFGEKYAVSGARPAELFTQALEKTWEELQPSPVRPIALDDDTPGGACGPQGCD